MYFFYYYPVGVDQQRQRPPVVTAALVAVMAVMFAWQHYFPRAIGFDPLRLIYLGPSLAPWTALTAILLHAGWFHLLSNLIYIAVFGPLLEDCLGHARFLLYFLMMGVCGNLTHGAVTASGLSGGGMVGVLGASGAIAGMLAFLMIRFPYARVAMAWWVFSPLQGYNRVGRSYIPLAIAVAVWLGLQVVYGLVSSEAGTHVAYGAHFGGFALGLFLALVLGYHREGRAGAKLARARRELEKGQVWAAEGALLEYLKLAPDDLDAGLQLARVRRMAGRPGDARETYRQTHARASAQGRSDLALAIYREARRGDAPLALPPAELAHTAFLLEKQGDFPGAVEAYLDLYRFHRSDGRAELALVRAAVLTRARLGDEAAARGWLEVALREFPEGLWRDYLVREFKLAAEPRAAGPAIGPGRWPSPAV